MTKTYDSKCHDLAEHFAQDEHLSKEDLHELAREIQETVENFFSTRDNAAERAYDCSMEEPTFRGGEYAASVQRELAEARKLK